MPYEVQSSTETEASVVIELTASELRAARDRKLREYAQRVRIPGFRPGKVPRHILEKKLGGNLDSEVRGELVDAQFQAAVREHELYLLSAPKLKDEDFQPTEDGGLRVSMTLEVLPNFPLHDYKGLEVSVPPPEISEEDIDRQIEDLRKRNVYSEEVEGAVESGDFILSTPTYQFLDGSSYVPDEPIHIATETGHVGAVQNDEAKEAFLGATVGEERKVTLQLPDDFAESEHRGKTAVVRCTVDSILRARVPEIDEAFLQKFNVQDVEGLRSFVRDRMGEHLERQREQMIEDVCVERLLATHDFSLPQSYLESERQQERERIRADLTQRQVAPGQIETHLLEVEGRLGEEVDRRCRVEILMDRIASKEGLKVSQEELTQSVVMMARSMGAEPQALFDRLVESEQVSSVVTGLRRTKARRFLREHAVTAEEKDQAGSPEGEGSPTEEPAPSAEQESS